MKSLKIIGGLVLVASIYACSNDPLDVSIDANKLEIKYTNLDSLMNNASDDRLLSTLFDQRVRIPNVIDYQVSFCMQAGMITDTSALQKLKEYRNITYVKRLEKRIEEKFSDLPKRHQKIVDGFKHIQVHLPKAKMPKEIIYTNSNFASSAFCTQDEITMGLERYLGKNTDVIKELPQNQFYDWIKEAMDDQYFERDAVCAWILTHIVEEKEAANNIETAIIWGKILYLTEAAFPNDPKHIIIRYSEKDYQWALENERAFWDFLIQQKLLFTANEADKANLFSEAPFTAGLPMKDAPDRLGQFLGWRIIQSYMEQNDVTLQELVALPYTELLQFYEINE
ncbi:MAG: hypothetical protein IT221_09095 [Fluviicola sp.]|nr:hypothetical protein [Fluviicola sp.]